MPLVTVSAKGQIVIPRVVRKRLGLEQGSKVRVDVAGRAAVLRPVKRGRTGWQRWKGHFAGKGLLKALASEHAKEIARDKRPRP